MLKNRKFFISLICIIFSFSVVLATVLFFGSFSSKADSINSIKLNAGVSYTVKTNGGSFWLSFGETGNDYERARVSFILSDCTVFSESNDSYVAAFSSSEQNCKNNNISSVKELSADQKRFLSSPNYIYSVILTSSSSNYSMLYRRGVANFISADYTGLEQNEVFGIYCFNLDMEFSFLVDYLFGSNITLYYESDVVVEVYDKTISVSLDKENITLYNSTGILREIYNEKVSVIPFYVNEPSNDKEVIKFSGIMVNGNRVADSCIINDAVKYFVYPLKEGDLVEFNTSRFNVDYNYEDVSVYDLFDISGEKSISFNETGKNYPIGNVPNKPNTAFRFKLKSPSLSWGPERATKFGLFTNNYMIWSNFGYIIAFYSGNVVIKTGEEVQLATGSCADLRVNSENNIEIGAMKGYKNGIYNFNRIYVKVNDIFICFYDEFETRGSLGSAVVGPVLDFADASCLIKDVRDYYIVSDGTKSDGISIDFKRFVEPNTSIQITIFEKRGTKLSKIFINGIDKTNSLFKEGLYLYLDVLVDSNTVITYELINDVSRNIFVENIQKATVDYSNSVLYHGNSIVKIHVSEGYSLKSLIVNGIEKIDETVYVDGEYVFYLNLVEDDIQIRGTTEKTSYNISIAKEENCEVILTSSIVESGKKVVFAVKPNTGYKISEVFIEGYILKSNSDGSFYIDSIRSDVLITAIAIQLDV